MYSLGTGLCTSHQPVTFCTPGRQLLVPVTAFLIYGYYRQGKSSLSTITFSCVLRGGAVFLREEWEDDREGEREIV